MNRVQETVEVGSLRFANTLPLTVIAGVNVLEDRGVVMRTAEHLSESCRQLEMPWVFKASFDKANRTSVDSYRGPGLEKGLRMLQEIKRDFGVPVLTDIHLPEQAESAAAVCDILQIPAFLCRQTDLIAAAAATSAALHIKKAQFLAPEDMAHIVEKCLQSGSDRIILCERGSQFGYHNLVVDMLGFEVMKQNRCPVTFDITHALQLPGGRGQSAGGRRRAALKLALAGVSQGLAGIFIECHPDPDRALCDGPSALPLEVAGDFLRQIRDLDRLVKSLPAISIR